MRSHTLQTTFRSLSYRFGRSARRPRGQAWAATLHRRVEPERLRLLDADNGTAPPPRRALEEYSLKFRVPVSRKPRGSTYETHFDLFENRLLTLTVRELRSRVSRSGAAFAGFSPGFEWDQFFAVIVAAGACFAAPSFVLSSSHTNKTRSQRFGDSPGALRERRDFAGGISSALQNDLDGMREMYQGSETPAADSFRPRESSSSI